MSWVKIDADFYLHPKVRQAGPLGIALQVAALCYCNKYLTDGFIPHDVIPALLNLNASNLKGLIEYQEVTESLVSAGLWEAVDGGFVIHDYLDYQPSREQLLREREQSKKRQERFRNGVTNGPVTAVSQRSGSGSGSGSGSRTHTDTQEDKPSVSPLQGKHIKKVVYAPITEGYIEEMVVEFKDQLGGEGRVREAVDDAMNHIAIDKAKDKRRYLKGWLQRNVERFASRNGAKPKSDVSEWADFIRPVTAGDYERRRKERESESS